MPAQTPLISILMPFLNVEAYLTASIQSVLNQTYPHWELILVDDGSTDNSRAIAARFAAQDTRIRLLTNATNMGIAYSCNRAFAVAKGLWIARCDADDIALPHRFERQIEAALQDPTICAWGSSAFEKGPNHYGILTRASGADVTTAATLFRIPIINTTLLLRRDVISRAAPLYDTRVMFEDYHLLANLVGPARFNNIAEPLMVINKHSDSFTAPLLGPDYAQHNIIYQAQLLRRMGLTPTPTELALHRKLVSYYDRTRQDRDFTDLLPHIPTRQTAAQWFAKVAKANATTGLLPAQALYHQMETILDFCPLEDFSVADILPLSHPISASPFTLPKGV